MKSSNGLLPQAFGHGRDRFGVRESVFDRWPILIWFGAGLLGWVAGGLMVEDPAFEKYLHWTPTDMWEYVFAAIAAAFVLSVGYIRHQMLHGAEKAEKKPKPAAKRQPAAVRRERVSTKR